MNSFQPGEIVDITITGARVREVKHYGHADGHCLKYEYAMPSGDMQPDAVIYDAPGVTVEHVAPAEWPPQPSDLWRDRDGDLWYALLVDDDDTADETYIVLRPGRSSKHPSYVHSDEDGIRRTYGPLKLAYREVTQ